MAEIKGTNIGSPIVPFTTDDIYATHEAKYGKGGYRCVSTIKDLDLIPEARREENMLVYVDDDPSGIHTYRLVNNKWVRGADGGIPIYNQELIRDLGIDIERETYISIPDKNTDLDSGVVEENVYRTSKNGNYVDVLFSAIRELQSEVARLKNSFRYGIESYTGKRTAMSETVGEIEVPEEEPLWAVEEDGLSEVFELDMTKENCLQGDLFSSVTDPVTFNTYLEIPKTSYWVKEEKALQVEDPKMFLYLTTKGTNIQIELLGYEETNVTTPDNSNRLDLDLSTLKINPESISGVYNTLVILGRKQIENNKIIGNSNFIWLSISNPETNQALVEGYWKDGKIVNLGDAGITDISDVEVPWRYQFNKITFNDTTLTKFKIYSKYQDFSKDIIGSIPSDETYKFKVAHITIRSVENIDVLTSLKDQILNNELIWDEGSARLWIKTNNKLAVIGGGSGSNNDNNSNMTQQELIDALKEMGIVYEEGGSLNINDLTVDGITFIHTATGRKYKFYINASGELCNEEIPNESELFSSRVTKANYKFAKDVRGFIGTLRLKEAGGSRTSDARLNSDRLKIGAFYAPYSEDLAHGCTHSYVELENTSDKDIALQGCYLHLTRPNSVGTQETISLPLTGIIKAGGTYLIRGARHAENSDPNVFIKVNTCDQEWWNNGSLVSFEIDENLTYTEKTRGYGFCLTYGNEFDGKPLRYDTKLVTKSSSATDKTVGPEGDTFPIGDNTSVYPYILAPGFIDGIYYKKIVEEGGGAGYWSAGAAIPVISNSIYRNTFELDPAKQAFQAFTTKDSSRTRWQNNDNDAQVVSLEKEYITFPHTDDVYAVANYTPKSSWEGKNVSTDKTKLDKEKPNMVTCSFGVDIYKTRTFNWISVGYFNEYLWVKKKGDNTWNRFSSYLPIQEIKVKEVTTSKPTADSTITKIKFSVSNTGWSNGKSLDKYTKLVGPNNELISANVGTISQEGGDYVISLGGSYTIQNENTCYLKQSIDEVATSTYPKKKFFNGDITNCIYSRITGRFPGDNSFYTSHKVIVDLVGTNVTSPTEYVYIVGRADKNGNPDPEHTSEEMSFTLYPDTYKTVIYQTSDQQGFHWIEYQVWSAAAKKLEEKIESDKKKAGNNIIPIIVNTGDMTQNGTRINEWYDYYQAGRSLFKKYEQVNVVGNNDLCGTDPDVLGTGDDNGKSNSFYFHLFYCYEVGSLFTPLLTPTGGGIPKYIPSLYYLDSKSNRFIMVNSELTETNCKDWFKVTGSTGNPVNVYTGFEINSSVDRPAYNSTITSIYTMLYDTMNNAKSSNKSIIAVCHEMPFTVITNDSLLKNYSSISRSLSNSSALVGSHLNQICNKESNTTKDNISVNKPGIYWFSRLLEFFGVKLCIGGHKHTYACTYPVRENYYYISSNGEKRSSKTDGAMPMDRTLENDSVNFLEIDNEGKLTKDLSKFPLTKRSVPTSSSNERFYPCEAVSDLSGGVTYFMCQSTGYKLTSNKELPSDNQAFSMLIPQTTTTYSNGSYSDKPSNEQKYPMFAIIEVVGTSYTIKLARVEGIFNSNYKFTQLLYGTEDLSLKYLIPASSNNFGTWQNSETALVTL